MSSVTWQCNATQGHCTATSCFDCCVPMLRCSLPSCLRKSISLEVLSRVRIQIDFLVPPLKVFREERRALLEHRSVICYCLSIIVEVRDIRGANSDAIRMLLVERRVVTPEREMKSNRADAAALDLESPQLLSSHDRRCHSLCTPQYS